MTAEHKRHLAGPPIAATALLAIAVCGVGYLSTGIISASCGVEQSRGYCARLHGREFPPLEEWCFILAPALVAMGIVYWRMRRETSRPLLRAGAVMLPLAAVLPAVELAVWK